MGKNVAFRDSGEEKEEKRKRRKGSEDSTFIKNRDTFCKREGTGHTLTLRFLGFLPCSLR